MNTSTLRQRIASEPDEHIEFAGEAGTVDRSIFNTERPRAFPGFTTPPPASQYNEAISERREDWLKPLRGGEPFTLAAGLAAVGLVVIAVIAIGALVAYQYLHESVRLAEKTQQIDRMATGVSGLQARVDALEAARAAADRAGGPVELRGGDASSPAFSAAMAQISARLDRVRDEAATHFAGIASRLDRLESNAAGPAALPPPPEVNRTASPVDPAAGDAASPAGAPQRALKGYALRRLRDGVATIKSAEGEVSVSVGDVIPGAGTFLRVERRGGALVVVTSLGFIKPVWRSPRARKPH